MSQYPLFLLFAALAVASPGPGVVLTLSNTLRYGIRGALWGMLGLSAGITIVAALSALGLAAILANSQAAFNLLKYLGALYLIYLGVKLWRSPMVAAARHLPNHGRFGEALLIQLSNPKVMFFFFSVFPQFIDLSSAYWQQFLLLVVSYSLLLIGIHCLYAGLALQIGAWVMSPRGGKIVNRLSGGAFVGFGISLALLG